MPANLENSAVATGLEKVCFHSSPNERQCQRMLKLPQVTLISHTSKVMLKILQTRLQQNSNRELPDVQAGFRTRDQISNICWVMAKAREFQKNIYSALRTMPKLLWCGSHKLITKFVWITTKLWKILQEMGILTTWPVSWEICMQVKKQQLEPDMEQCIGSK